MKTDKGSEQTRLQRRGNGQQAQHHHPRGTRRSKPQAASPGVATTGELDTTGAAEPSRAPRVRVGTQPGAASARSSPRLRGRQTKAAPPSGPARPGEPASGHLPKGAQSGTSERPWHTHVHHRHCRGRRRQPASTGSSPRGPGPGRQAGRVDKGSVRVQRNVTRPLMRRQPCHVPGHRPHSTALSSQPGTRGKGHRTPPEEVSKVVEIRSRKQWGEESDHLWVRDLCAMQVRAASRAKVPDN